MFPSDIPGRLLHFCVNEKLVSPSPEVSPLGFFLIAPYVVLSCPLMIVSSCYGFAAIDRARDEQLISPERARKYKWGLALPIADLVAAIWLYARLRRLDGTVPTCTPDDDPLSPARTTPQPVADIDDILATRPAQTRRGIPHPLAYSPTPRSLTLFRHRLLRRRACHHDLSPSVSDTSIRCLVPRHVCVRRGDYR